MKQVFFKFIESLFQRKIMFGFFFQFEKWALLGLAYTDFNLNWEYVAFFIGKDMIILALLGLVQFEKISLKASVGGGNA